MDLIPDDYSEFASARSKNVAILESSDGPGLERVIANWPDLPLDVRVEIVALASKIGVRA